MGFDLQPGSLAAWPKSRCSQEGRAEREMKEHTVKERKGKGNLVVPACVGSLAEVEKLPVTKSVRAGEQEQDIYL
eukprot:1152162-Pelagomonas_calceolata.AAC.2